VAPPIVDHAENGLTELSQRYVIAPEPVPAVVDVNAAGSPESQMVCAEPMAPAVTAFCTVTSTAVEAEDSHATEFSVDMVIRLYCVVAVKPEGAS
jgi:hypothetical protein